MVAQKLGLDGIETERAYRVKPNNRDSKANRPGTIVVKLTWFKDKTKILQSANKLEGTKYINKKWFQ